MKFKSINNHSQLYSFQETLFQGIAPDGSLFIPEHIPSLPKAFIDNLQGYSLIDIATTVLSAWLDEIPKKPLEKMIKNTFHFPFPLTPIASNLFLLELFHGPTLAFKDVGARFMAEATAYYLNEKHQTLTILVATSGDTGSAVAHGFYGIRNINVYILYPSGKITPLQEKQMTTLGGNIHAIEVQGSFDDCQYLVKQSLIDKSLKSQCHLTTANSMNIARLLPQLIYYFCGIAELRRIGIQTNCDIVVPSGNFGNLTAASYAKHMGAPIEKLIAATNSNDIVPKYLETGRLETKPSHATFSNAMDVGNPSNLSRLQALYDNDVYKMKNEITGIAISDQETLATIKSIYDEKNIIIDPHTAVGVAAALKIDDGKTPTIIASTAHPGKFPDVVKRALNFDMELPDTLKKAMARTKETTLMEPDFETWKSFLVSHTKQTISQT